MANLGNSITLAEKAGINTTNTNSYSGALPLLAEYYILLQTEANSGGGGGGGAITMAAGAVAAGAYSAGSLVDGAITTIGSTTDAAAVNPIAGTNYSAISLYRNMVNSLATLVTNSAGASTSALQTTANGYLNTIASNTTGASTSALQTTGNNTLTSIKTDMDILSAARNNQDTFTATGAGASQNASATPVRLYTLQIKATGAVTSCSVNLELSLDNITWFIAGSATLVSAASNTIFAVDKPASYYRANCTALVLGAGTNVLSSILALR
jgi:hypothetical protein